MKLESILNTIITAITIVVIAFIASQQVGKWMDNQKTARKEQAVVDCIKVATYTTESTTDGTKFTATQPVRDWYRFCMNEKGYK